MSLLGYLGIDVSLGMDVIDHAVRVRLLSMLMLYSLYFALYFLYFSSQIGQKYKKGIYPMASCALLTSAYLQPAVINLLPSSSPGERRGDLTPENIKLCGATSTYLQYLLSLLSRDHMFDITYYILC